MLTGTMAIARRIFGAALVVSVLALGVGVVAGPALHPGVAQAQEAGGVPGGTLGTASDSEFWREVRGGAQGTVSIPDKKAGVMVQSSGENWRAVRNGPLSRIGIWLLAGMIVALALFFAARGRIKIDSGLSGRLIERFNTIERVAHWLTAGSFVLLAFTGLNVLYGRYMFAGQAAPSGEFGTLHAIFAVLTYYGKLGHHFIAFAFMAGLILTFGLWVRDNIPDRLDLKWLAVAGGLLTKGVHPPARKFNAGQKIMFWAVILGGLSLSLSGLSMMFPFTIPLFAKTFAVLNLFGLDLPTAVSGVQEMQLSQVSHASVALMMATIIIAHIYIGSLGMEGAFDAMGSGMVDENWAREHHGLWVAEVRGETPPAAHDGEAGAAAPKQA